MSSQIQALGGVRSVVLRGFAWKAASQVVSQGSRMVVALVLARLLAPHDYGVAGMVLVFSSLVIVFADLALGAALVQRPTLTEADRSTVFWTSAGAGVVFTLAGIALSGPVASFYHQPEVRPLVIALSFSFLVTSLATTQEALLVRALDFRPLELRMMVANLVGAGVGIGAALAGWGAWAIILQQLAIAVASSTLLWLVSPWRPSFRFSRASLRDLGGFGGNVFGQRLLYYLHRNTDNLLVGRFLGAASLGAYTLAYNVMLVPFSRFAGPLQEVLFPTFSRLQDEPERVAAIWLRTTRLVGALAIPSLAGLAVVGPDFVAVVLGPRWHAAGPVLQILTWVGLLQALQTPNTHILQALDRSRTVFRYSLVFFFSHLAAFAIGLRWGIVGVAACYAVSSTIVEPLYAWITARAVGISPLAVVRSVGGIVQATLALVAVALPVRLVLVHADVPAAARLVVVAVAGAAVFVPLCAWRSPELVAEVKGLRRR